MSVCSKDDIVHTTPQNFFVVVTSSSPLTINAHAAIDRVFHSMAKGLARNALPGQKFLQLCRALRKNRTLRDSVAQIKAEAAQKKPQRWYPTLCIGSIPYNVFYAVVPSPCLTTARGVIGEFPFAASDGKNVPWTSAPRGRACIHLRAGLATYALCDCMLCRQICIWVDNLTRYRSGFDPRTPDLMLNCTAVVVLHTSVLPHYSVYSALPELAQVAARYQWLQMTCFDLCPYFLTVLMSPTEVLREYVFVPLWALHVAMYVS